LSYQGKSFLLTSDIRDDEEEVLEFRETTVVQASHHGSIAGNDKQDLIHDTNPSRIIISSGTNKRHPEAAVFERFEDRNGAKIDTYWTGVHGDVTFIVDDGTLYPIPWGWITDQPEVESTTDPDKLKERAD